MTTDTTTHTANPASNTPTPTKGCNIGEAIKGLRTSVGSFQFSAKTPEEREGNKFGIDFGHGARIQASPSQIRYTAHRIACLAPEIYELSRMINLNRGPAILTGTDAVLDKEEMANFVLEFSYLISGFDAETILCSTHRYAANLEDALNEKVEYTAKMNQQSWFMGLILNWMGDNEVAQKAIVALKVIGFTPDIWLEKHHVAPKPVLAGGADRPGAFKVPKGQKEASHVGDMSCGVSIETRLMACQTILDYTHRETDPMRLFALEQLKKLIEGKGD